MLAAHGFDELSIDPDAVPLPLYAPLQNVMDAQLLGDLSYVDRLALIGPTRVTRDHEDAGELGEIGDEILGHAINEITLFGIGAQVVEGQHGDRGLIRQRQRHTPDGCGYRRPLLM